MIELLKTIVDVITSFVGFVIHSIQSLLNLLFSIPRFTVYIFNLVNAIIPDVLKPFIIISIIVSIILLIIGRK